MRLKSGIAESQIPVEFREIIDGQVSTYNEGRSITIVKSLPDTTKIPIENPKHWLRIPDVICVYVDMKNSTALSAESHDNSTAGAYQLYTETAVRLFAGFGAPYIDVRGDGAFALFNSDQPHRALSAAVTFKTFASTDFTPHMQEKTGLDVGSRMGIDLRTVLVRKVGLKRHAGRSDRQNEVWAGRPVNMAAKLASVAEDDQLLVSDRFFTKLTDEHATLSCGCPGGKKVGLWEERDLSSDHRFDFDVAHALKSIWCSTHGGEYCDALLGADEDD